MFGVPRRFRGLRNWQSDSVTLSIACIRGHGQRHLLMLTVDKLHPVSVVVKFGMSGQSGCYWAACFEERDDRRGRAYGLDRNVDE